MFKEGHSLCSKKDNPCVQRRIFLVFKEGHPLCSKKDIPCVQRRTSLVFKEGYSLCSKKDIPCVRRRTFLVFEDDKTPIFGRTDLRNDVSEAKFDADVDFHVQKCLAPPKSAENRKQIRKISEKKFGVKKSKVANRPKRVFPKFRGDRSEVRGANGILMRRPSMQNQKYKTNGPSLHGRGYFVSVDYDSITASTTSIFCKSTNERLPHEHNGGA